jgi:hypothetical protein
MTTPLYEIGNLYTGRPYAVIVTRQFGSYEVYGPYGYENQANTAAHELAETILQGETVGVVQIDLQPAMGRRIARNEHGLLYQPV